MDGQRRDRRLEPSEHRARTLPTCANHHIALLLDLRPPRAFARVPPARAPPRFAPVARAPPRAPPFSPPRALVVPRRLAPPPRLPPPLVVPRAPRDPPRLPADISSPISWFLR